MAPVEHMTEGAKRAVDTGAIGVALGTLFNWLPGIASLLTVIWMTLRIYETVLSIRSKRRALLRAASAAVASQPDLHAPD